MEKEMIDVVPIDPERVKEEIRDVVVLVKQSQEIVIKTQSENEKAAVVLSAIKGRYKELDERRKQITKPLDEAKQRVMDLFRQPLDDLKEAESIIKKAISNFADEQERIVREAQRKLEEEARKKAEEERRRKEEQERQWREKQAKLEAEGKFEEARKAQEKADQRALEAQSVVEEVVPLVMTNIQTKGISYREQWKAEIVDIDLLPREYMLPNQQALDKVAQATKGTIPISGVRFICNKIVASK